MSNSKRVQTRYSLAEEYAWHQQSALPPVSENDLVQAEAQLGFVLPSLLRSVYREVGNGGFGPGYGLFPLNKQDAFSDAENDLVTAYLGMRSMTQKDIDEYWEEEPEKPVLWPEQVLIICDWGCNSYTCLDCASSALPLFHMDANESLGMWAIEEPPTFPLWLQSWIDGKPLFHFDWSHAKKVSIANLRVSI